MLQTGMVLQHRVITVDSCIVSIDSTVAKPGDTIRLALRIRSIEKSRIGAFGFHVSYDSSLLSFQNVENYNSIFRYDSILFNKIADTLNFAWSNMNDIIVPDNIKLCDLEFVYLGGQGVLTFLDGSMVGGIDYSEFNVTFNEGVVGPLT